KLIAAHHPELRRRVDRWDITRGHRLPLLHRKKSRLAKMDAEQLVECGAQAGIIPADVVQKGGALGRRRLLQCQVEEDLFETFFGFARHRWIEKLDPFPFSAPFPRKIPQRFSEFFFISQKSHERA